MSTIINATTTNGVVIQPDNSGSLVLQTNSGTTALTIDASQRAAFVAGTAALPAITTTGDTNTGMWFPAADTIAFSEGGAEAVRIDSSGNVGIGTTSPASSLDVQAVDGRSIIRLTATTGTNPVYSRASNTGGFLYLGRDGSAGTDFGAGAYAAGVWSTGAYPMVFGTNGTERMRIDSSGNVLVGTTSSVRGTPKLQSVNAADVAALFQCGSNSANNIVSWMNTTSGTRYHVAFGDGSTYTERGFISTNGSTTTYSTTSDYRLKDNIIPMAGALDIVNKLKPVTYTWKENGLNGQGFIAHELAEFMPDAVVGEKDAVNEDGLIKPQSIDTSFLVATLTAAIQEQQALINDLKARIETLEAK